MSDETERAKEIGEAVKAADAKKRADAEEAALNGERLDKVLSCLDAITKRMDMFDDAVRRKDAKDEDGEDEGDLEDPDKPRKP